MVKADQSGTRAKGAGRRPRIFLGPIEIAGYYAGLEAGLRELGVDVVGVDLAANPFRYGAPESRLPVVFRLSIRARAIDRAPRTPRFVRWLAKLARFFVGILCVAWATVRFDAFVFGFGTSIFGLRELPLLRLLGKRIVFVFHGSDARPPYIDGPKVAPDRAPPVADRVAMTRQTKTKLARIERYAHAVIAQPAFSHFFEKPVIDWFVVGMPWRVRSVTAPAERGPGSTVRILHSPSNPVIKGSPQIRAAVEQLQAEGLDLELVELRDVPNEVVLREIAVCDFVVDQIYSDAPMVGFATEAAAAGKPAIVGGYAWPENHRILRGEMPPVEECAPEEIAAAIRRLATDRDYREDLGRRAQVFVAGWSAVHVAERMLAVIDGSAPRAWWFNPNELRYLEGCGLSRADVRASVGDLLAAGGTAALCLSDKPELERQFVAFAAGKE